MLDQELHFKITQALERISKTFRVLLWEESKKHQVSPIQIQILVFCLSHKQEMLKVSSFAKEFDLTNATISDSVKVLLKKELLDKVPNPKDSRSYTVSLSKKGKKIAEEVAHYSQALEESINWIPKEEKGLFLKNLLAMIEHLNQNEIISIQRMCLTCQHYNKEGNSHYCSLLKKALQNSELQIDCPEHQTMEA